MDGYSELTPDNSKSVYSTKVHSSFGYAVALTDINGDGLDDLIVGAPQFYEDSRKLKAGGALYIYLNEVKKDFGLDGLYNAYFVTIILPLAVCNEHRKIYGQ